MAPRSRRGQHALGRHRDRVHRLSAARSQCLRRDLHDRDHDHDGRLLRDRCSRRDHGRLPDLHTAACALRRRHRALHPWRLVRGARRRLHQRRTQDPERTPHDRQEVESHHRRGQRPRRTGHRPLCRPTRCRDRDGRPRTPTRQRMADRHRRSHRGPDPARRWHRTGDHPHRRARLRCRQCVRHAFGSSAQPGPPYRRSHRSPAQRGQVLPGRRRSGGQSLRDRWQPHGCPRFAPDTGGVSR